jgi:hypothetical protein
VYSSVVDQLPLVWNLIGGQSRQLHESCRIPKTMIGISLSRLDLLIYMHG